MIKNKRQRKISLNTLPQGRASYAFFMTDDYIRMPTHKTAVILANAGIFVKFPAHRIRSPATTETSLPSSI